MTGEADARELETLRGARARIAKGWTQRSFARDAAGDPVNMDEPQAASWCLTGALTAARRGEAGDAGRHLAVCRLERLTGDLRRIGYQRPLYAWNDAEGRTHTEVLDLLDRAVDEAERDGVEA